MADPGVQAILKFLQSKKLDPARISPLLWSRSKVRAAGLGPGARAYVAWTSCGDVKGASMLFAHGPECGWVFSKPRLKVCQDGAWLDVDDGR